MKRRICIVTGTRAEFGLLRFLMQRLEDDPTVDLQVVATGMHLSPAFGSTYREIEAAGFSIAAKVEMLLSSDSSSATTKSIGLGVIGFADAFAALRPDLIVLLGDRFEILAAAIAAMVAGVPVAHLHGGETTEGAFDEAIRHSITKMAHLHFVAAPEYRKRVIQLGEHPERVFLVGGLGVDAILHTELLDRAALEESIGIRLREKMLLITFHPVTLDLHSSGEQMQELLAALSDLSDTSLIFTMPNADTGNSEITSLLNQFVDQTANAHLFSSLGQRRYLSCMKLADGVIGNSSSGLAEAPSFRIGTVNIGDRQKGRLRAQSVIDCPPERDAIREAISTLYSDAFQRALSSVTNPYGDGGASERIARTLSDYPLAGLLKKTFHDLPVERLVGGQPA